MADDQVITGSVKSAIASSCTEEGSTSISDVIPEDISPAGVVVVVVQVDDGILEGKAEEIDGNNDKIGEGNGLPKVCRICHDVEDQGDMEAPCACKGTMKYAHRACVQKWCDAKGNIICEICRKVFRPNYTFTRTTPNPDLAIDIGGHVIEFYEDVEAQETRESRGRYYCRIIGFIVLILVIFRQILSMYQGSGALHNAPHIVNVFIDVVGVMVPVYLVGQICYVSFFNGRW